MATVNTLTRELRKDKQRCKDILLAMEKLHGKSFPKHPSDKTHYTYQVSVIGSTQKHRLDSAKVGGFILEHTRVYVLTINARYAGSGAYNPIPAHTYSFHAEEVDRYIEANR